MEHPPMRPPSTMSMPMYHQQQALTGIDHPHNNDVLCGRGVTTNRHAGNESFRSLVNCNKELYVTSTKKQKMKISRSIVEAVRSLEPPGRFLEKDQNSGKWFDIGDKKAVEKTSQALRDGAAGLRKQLSEDLSDPDFLSAVFDMDVAPPDRKVDPTLVKKDIKKPPLKKGHRRIKSNPIPATAGRSKNLIKKQTRGPEVPVSPRTRHTIAVSVCGKPPQSPSPLSPHSAGGSPRPNIPPMSIDRAPHRRVHSQGFDHVHMPISPGSMPYRHPLRSAQRSTHFEYHDNPEYRRPPPAPYGSPGGPYPPPPRSPSAHPGSPYGRPYNPPISPRWSPRSGYTRSGPSLSPHPYMHPSDFHRRASPDRHHHPPPPSSPRDHYTHPHYPPSHGTHVSHGLSSSHAYHNGHHHLAVPSLGAEYSSHPNPLHSSGPSGRYPRPPVSPRHLSSPISHGSTLPIDFTPPTTYSRGRGASPLYHKGPEMPISMDDDEYADEKKEEADAMPDQIKYESDEYNKEKEAAPFDEKPSSESPSAVADVAQSSTCVKQEDSRITEERRMEDEYPSDEDPDPAGSSRCLSPLPFDSREDPNSLMELPDNLLSLPISPCGPNDDEGEI